jgi:MFS family permease
VVSTALVDISNGLHGFSKTSWVLVSYLATYTGTRFVHRLADAATKYLKGMMVVWAKLSDVAGRKNALMVSLLLFSAFSAGCGVAQTLTQLFVQSFIVLSKI